MHLERAPKGLSGQHLHFALMAGQNQICCPVVRFVLPTQSIALAKF